LYLLERSDDRIFPKLWSQPPMMKIIKICCLCLLPFMVLAGVDNTDIKNTGVISNADLSDEAVSAQAQTPYEVMISRLDLIDDRGAERSLRVLYPHKIGRYPLVIFSHGNWSDNTKYDALMRYWAGHGYVVVMPYHLDGGGMVRGIFNALRYGQLGLIAERSRDIHWVMDALPELAQQSPALAARMQVHNIAVAGHSFGAYTAQQMIGAGAFDEGAERWHYARDERVKAVVAISPPGPMFSTITEHSWRQVDKPMLVTTGTADVNEKFWPDWRLHLMSYETARLGHNHSLVVDGADHYLGNLICRPERDQPPQQEALRVINSVSVAFLDWQLKGERRLDAAWVNDAGAGLAVYGQR